MLLAAINNERLSKLEQHVYILCIALRRFSTFLPGIAPTYF
jgi:hypothetical protein